MEQLFNTNLKDMILIKTKEYNVNGIEFTTKLWLRSLNTTDNDCIATFAIQVKGLILPLSEDYSLVDCTIDSINIEDYLFELFYEAYLGKLSRDEFCKTIGLPIITTSMYIDALHKKYNTVYKKASKLFSDAEIKELYNYFNN